MYIKLTFSGVFFAFYRSYNPLLFKLTSNGLDFSPLIIIGETFANFFSFSGMLDVIFYFLNQFYRFSATYLNYYASYYNLDFFKNICFISNYSFKIHAFALNLHLDFVNEYLNYYIKQTLQLNEFIFLFGVEVDLLKLDPNARRFIVYQGTHGDLVRQHLI